MRWVYRILGAIAVIGLLTALALVVVPTERVATLVTDRISAATGREVVIEGDVRPTIWPNLGIRANGIRVGNPDWVDAGPLVAADTLHVSVGLVPLLRGEIRLAAAELIGPDITLMRAEDGRVSWAMAADPDALEATVEDAGADVEDAPADGGILATIGFDRAEISGGRVRWIDRTADQDILVSGINAVLSLPSAEGRATLDAGFEIAGTTMDFDAAIEGIGPLLEGQVRLGTATFSWDGGTVEFDGRLSLAPALDGQLDVDISDLGPLMAITGGSAPALPDGLGRDDITLGGWVTLTDAGSLHLRQGQLALDRNALAMEFDVLQGAERPFIRGAVLADRFDLPGLMEGGDSGGGGGGGWPDDRIDVSALFTADAEVNLRLGRVGLGGPEVGPIDLTTTIDRGRMVMNIDGVGLYGGQLTGNFVVNGRGGLSTGGDLLLAGVQLNPLLEEFVDWDRLEGSGSASLQFLAVGNSVNALMRSLEGQGDISFGSGAIRGFDLAGMIRNLDASFQGSNDRTVYDSIGANFTIAGGVLSNEDLLLDAPWGEVRGQGSVDLGAQSMDYRVIPGVMRDDAGVAGIQVPVMISGPWSGLSFRPDLEFLAQQELEEQRERLEEEARRRLEQEAERIEGQVQDQVGEFLGIDLFGSGDGAEEAVDAPADASGDAGAEAPAEAPAAPEESNDGGLLGGAGGQLLELLGGGSGISGGGSGAPAEQ